MKPSKWALGIVLGGIAGAACAQTALPLSGEDGDPTSDATTTATTTGGGGSANPTTTTGATGQGGGATTSTTSATRQGGTGSTSTTSTTSSGQGGTGSTTSTCHPPTTLHPPKPGKPSIFCPFSGVDGGKNDYCTAQIEHCCEPKSGGASCVPADTPCDAGDTDWQCEDPVADCAGGEVCCGKGTFVENPDPTCANYAKGFTGTYCAKSCQPGEIVMCTDSSECGGTTCKPMYTKGNQVGACD